jgi:hypothetical protein
MLRIFKWLASACSYTGNTIIKLALLPCQWSSEWFPTPLSRALNLRTQDVGLRFENTYNTGQEAQVRKQQGIYIICYIS